MYTTGAMNRNKLILGLLLITLPLKGQPGPGDLFREYIWLPEMVNEHGKFLRVGGKYHYSDNPSHFPPDRHQEGYITLDSYVNLRHASKAEVMVEKIASHDDTKGLRISWNQHGFFFFPEADSIPSPESVYMHHTNPVVGIPLNQLRGGYGNQFSLQVDTEQRWNWPQHLIYALILRVYYSSDSLADYTRNFINAVAETKRSSVNLSLAEWDEPIRQVDYLGYYTGINYQGDGRYQQWHHRFLRGKIQHHIGSTSQYPFSLIWNTEWVPDQSQDLQLAARIVYHNGLTYFTPAKLLSLPDRSFKVLLAKPSDQPKNWVTREAELSEQVQVTLEPSQITQAKLLWTSWSACYNQGLKVNGHLIRKVDGPCYEYADHEISIDPSLLQLGINEITTLKEPLHDGEMVHGMEVQYPGIMMLIKTDK